MKRHLFQLPRGIKYIGTVFVLGLAPYYGVNAQTVEIMANPDPATSFADTQLTLHLDIEESVSPYFFSTEIMFDTSTVIFIGADPGTLMSGGIHIAEHIEPGHIGASVSRTDEIDEPQSGSLMSFNFLIKRRAPGGESIFRVTELEMIDSDENDIPVNESLEEPFFVQAGLSELELLLAENSETTEGDLITVGGRVYVNGVTDAQQDFQESIKLWAGIGVENTHPENWEESAWFELDFLENGDEGSHYYEGRLGHQVSPGQRYIALRGRYNGGDFKYGGIYTGEDAGFWDSEQVVSAEWIVSETPPFRYTVAGWNFEGETMLADKGLPANRGREFYLVGATHAGYSSGANGLGASSRGWNGGENGSSYWLAHISTLEIGKIRVSSFQYASNSGPRDMQLQAGTDGVNWVDIDGGTVTLENNWSGGVLHDIPLPPEYDNLPDLFLRWVPISDTRVDGGENISSQGTSRIDDVSITGENLNPENIDIWPGDTDNNGQVDETDVLKLGTNWLVEGPKPVFNTTSWTNRQVESWLPVEATYADTDGNGLVDHRDLKVIGLNFGESLSPGRTIPDNGDGVIYETGPINNGESVYLSVETTKELFFAGLSYRFSLTGPDWTEYDIITVEPASWAHEWQEGQSLLNFDWISQDTGERAGAFIHKGQTAEIPATNLLLFKISSRSDKPTGIQLELTSLFISNSAGTRNVLSNVRLSELDPADMDSDDGISEKDGKPILLSNFPNPANGFTNIGYWLPADGHGRLELYDISGRLIRVLADGLLTGGYHEVRLNTRNLANSTYIYRLLFEGQSQTGKLTIIQ